MKKYSYKEIREAAIAPNATREDINALGEWLSQYDAASWNGEYYDADGIRLYPIYQETADELELTGYEIRLV